MTDLVELPLFPLRTVLFRGGQLPLRIFEPRYLDMVGTCMRAQSGFGVVLIRSGPEARVDPGADQPDVFDVGTVATIVDFSQTRDGLLGIIAVGGRKFRIEVTYETDDHLLMAKAQFLPDERIAQVVEDDQDLVEILHELIGHPMIEKMRLDIDFEDAGSVGCRLAELLPIEPEIKQSLLQMHLPRERLAELKRLVTKLRA